MYTFIHVNYNSSDLTINCIKSILKIEEKSNIIIVDNNSTQIEKNKLLRWIENNEFNTINVHFIFESLNHGYFGALNIGLNYMKNNSIQSEYVTIGNNDLIFDSNYFEELRKFQIPKDVYVIAPNIIKTNGVHQNPYAIKRTKIKRKILHNIFYLNYYFAEFILFVSTLLNQKRSSVDSLGFDSSQFVFAGHGSCYILTKSYFANNFLLDDRTFLMGEEYFFAQQILKSGGKIYYDKSLIVTHNEHSSMISIPSKTVFKHMQKAHKLVKHIY
jgi:GT2 family glycosyltransferase